MPFRSSAALRFDSLPAAPFYFGFMITGLVTVMLGPVLPVLSARWGLSDVQAGYLFAAQFSGSTLGSAVSSYHRRASLVVGYAGIAAGLLAVAFGSYAVALGGFALLGVGLGLAITATNLLFGTEYPERRGALLTKANFWWGVGAVVCPTLVALAERYGGLRWALAAAAAAAVGTAAVLSPLLRAKDGGRVEEKRDEGGFDLRVFLLFSAVLFLYVGGETSVSGWIATYAHRFIQASPGHAGIFLSPERSGIFVSAFWLAIVAGRAVVPALLGRMGELTVLLAGLAAAMAGVAVLLHPQSFEMSLAAVVLAGLGCSPVFPLLAARLMGRVGRSRHTGWIFAICGFGGAVVPWLTGALSAYTDSLRLAFVVPLAALGAIVALVLGENALPARKVGQKAGAAVHF